MLNDIEDISSGPRGAKYILFFDQAIVSVQVIDNLLFDSLQKHAGDTEEADVAILQRG